MADGTAPLVREALHAFDEAARLRVEEVSISPTFDAGSFRSSHAVKECSGFTFALRALAVTTPYASEGITEALLQWHDHEREQVSNMSGEEEARAVRECAVNIVFCESTLAVLQAHTVRGASRGAILLDAMEQRSLEFFLLSSATRQITARRRLAVLAGRSEEVLWMELVCALSKYRFESITNKILTQLEVAASGASRSRKATPGKGSFAMCHALRGLQLPGLIGKSASGIAQTLAFLQRVERLLANKQLRSLHRPLCEALGNALLDQQLRLSEAAACRADPPAGDEADTLSAHSLQRLQVQLSLGASARLGMRRTLTASFESWGAPLAAALACAAIRTSPGMSSSVNFGEVEADLHMRLQRKLLKCLKQSEVTHRLLALRCLRVQVITLLVERGASKEMLALLDLLFFGRLPSAVLKLELPREKDVPHLLQQYAELVEGFAAVGLAVSRHKLDLAVERIVRPGLQGSNWEHSGVLALACLRKIVEDRRERRTVEDRGCLDSRVRDEVVQVLLRMVKNCSSSPYLLDGSTTHHWLLTLQLLCGAMRCLCLLWPPPVQEASQQELPLPLSEILPIAATQLCSMHRPLQDAAAELLEVVVSSTPDVALPLTLDSLLGATTKLLTAGYSRRYAALAQVVSLLSKLLSAPSSFSDKLSASVNQLQAFAFHLFTEPHAKLRGEAADLLLLLSRTMQPSTTPFTERGSGRVSSLVSCEARSGLPDPSGQTIAPGSPLTAASVGEMLAHALPSIMQRALSEDPLQIELWGGAARTIAAQQASCRLRHAAERRCLRTFAEAAGATEGELQIWLCCVQGMAHTLLRAGGGSSSVLCASWRWLVQRCPRPATSNSIPQEWPPAASLACAAASAVLQEVNGESRREEAERLVREGVRLLLSDSEQHQLAGSAALGQLRGGSALQLVLSELGLPMRQAQLLGARDADYARHATKNPTSRCHMTTRQLCHVLSLLSCHAGWADQVASCGAPLSALSHFTHSVIDYLEKPWNLHAWSLQRTRLYVFTLMSHCTPSLLGVLASNVSGEQRAGLRPAALLSRCTRLLHASVGEGAVQAFDNERARLMQCLGAEASASSLIEGELRAQAEATQAAALNAIGGLATPEAVNAMEDRQSPLLCTEALLHSHSPTVRTAARKALSSLWAAAIEPLPSCLERCYTSTAHITANANFEALVPIALQAEGAGTAEIRVALLVLALSKLADPDVQVRESAQRVLHAHGAGAKTRVPPALLGEGLPRTAPMVQLEISGRLALTLPALAPSIVSEVLMRARAAAPSAAGMLLDFLPPWIEQVNPHRL